MNQKETQMQDFNRRDFLKSGSVATLMTMLGGVELIAQNTAAPADAKPAGPKLKVAVIGLGAWGRELLNTLARIKEAEVAAVCDTYPAFLKRGATLAPGAKQVEDYKAILADKEIKAVIIATPTHQHKEIAVAALAADKHVYCEAPLASNIEDARAIASAAKAAKHLVFQAGLQMRSDTQRQFLLPFIRSGAIGQNLMARAQWHRKQSWRATSPKPEREKELNWRLNKATSLGLAGELGIHPLDQAVWYLNSRPKAVSGFGTVAFWKDGRDVADTVQVVLELASGSNFLYDATLANSFDGEYEVLYGTDAAVMMRENKAWLFKEVDSPLLGWEVYASKETFYKETGIVLRAGASKSVPTAGAAAEPEPYTNTPVSFSLTNFMRNAGEYTATSEDYISSYGDDKAGLVEALAKVGKRPAAGYQDAYAATVTVIKANEAIATGQRIEMKPEWYELT